MREKQVALQLCFGRRELVALAAVALVTLGAGTLSTESLTLTTYYPSPYGVYSQVRTTDNTFLAYTQGTVAIGTNSPPNGYKLYNSANSYTAGKATMASDAEVDGGLGVNGAFQNVNNTGISVYNKNIHVHSGLSGNWLRLGDGDDSSGPGVFSERGDLVLGAASNRILIGGQTDNMYIAQACRNLPYFYPDGVSGTSCPTGWSVYGIGDSNGNTGEYWWGNPPQNRVVFQTGGGGGLVAYWVAGNGALGGTVGAGNEISNAPATGMMMCCKLQQY